MGRSSVFDLLSLYVQVECIQPAEFICMCRSSEFDLHGE